MTRAFIPGRIRNVTDIRGERRGMLYQALIDPTCCFCGRMIGPRFLHEPTIEHIIPLLRGGAHDRFNLEMSCPRCNVRKANRLLHKVCIERAKLIRNHIASSDADGMTCVELSRWIARHGVVAAGPLSIAEVARRRGWSIAYGDRFRPSWFDWSERTPAEHAFAAIGESA